MPPLFWELFPPVGCRASRSTNAYPGRVLSCCTGGYTHILNRHGAGPNRIAMMLSNPLALYYVLKGCNAMNLPFGNRASRNQNDRWIVGNHHSMYQASQKEGTMTAPLTEATSALSKVQGWERVSASGTCRGLSRDCVRLHRYTLAGVRALWSPCLGVTGTGRA